MVRRTKPLARAALAAAFLFALASVGAASAKEPAAEDAAKEESTEDPRPTMSGIFEVLAQLLPASLDDRTFSQPEKRAEIQGWIDSLARSAQALDHHARRKDPGFRFLSRSLSGDIREIQSRFARGRYAEASFFVHQLTENCIACHSRLPSPRDFPLAERLFERIEVGSLEPRERIRLLVATRRFHAALDEWEARFADPDASPTDLDLEGALVDYLTVCIRVQEDLARPARALRALASRPDTPSYLRGNLEAWAASLDDLREAPAATGSALARSRALADRARKAGMFPIDRRGVVYDLAASALLYREIEARRLTGTTLAEAYYLLGGIEARTGRATWVPEAEFHLETAVRLAPGAPFARDAYDLLEEYTVLNYGGSSGIHVPPDVEHKLAELRQLIDAAP